MINKFVIFSLDKGQWQGMEDRGTEDHDWYAEVNRRLLFIISYPREQWI